MSGAKIFIPDVLQILVVDDSGEVGLIRDDEIREQLSAWRASGQPDACVVEYVPRAKLDATRAELDEAIEGRRNSMRAWATANAERVELRHDRDALRAALEFYANPDNHAGPTKWVAIDDDNGDRARAALAAVQAKDKT
jgi:hypothetical protein